MKKKFLLSSLILFSLFLNAQTRSGNVSDIQSSQKNRATQTSQDDDKKGFRRENLRFGGSLGATFGPITFVDVSPAVGYQFTRRFQAGVGITYNYYADSRFTPRFSMHTYGASPYTQFSLIQLPSLHIFARAEYGLLNYSINLIEPKRQWFHYPMVGGGILLPIGRGGGVSLQVMWDLIEKDFSIYGQNPIIRMGIMLGL
jgi:hypothetical protein